jgi:predicted phosphohydrolase
MSTTNLTFGEYYEVAGHTGVYNVLVTGNNVHVWCTVQIEKDTVVFKRSSVRISTSAQARVREYMDMILLQGYVPFTSTNLHTQFNKHFNREMFLKR